MATDFKIDPEFKAMLPKLTKEEFAGLRKQIMEREEVDALVIGVIQGDRFLVDGHNRLEICEGEGVRYPTREMHFPDRDGAKLWIAENQLARRNLTPEQRSYYIGQEYLAKKNQDGKALPQNEGDGETAEKLAKKHKVGRSTVERDADFAKGADALTPEAKQKVLSGEKGQTKKEISTGIFCPRCTRVGPTKNCQDCADLRASSGKKPSRAPAKPKDDKPKSGDVLFDWKPWEADFGKLYRQVDTFGRGYKCKESDQATALRAKLREFKAMFRQWFREVTGKKPPSE